MKELPEAILQHVYTATGAHALSKLECVQSLWSGYGQIVRLSLIGGEHASVIVKHVQPMAAAELAQRSHARKLRSYFVEWCFYERYSRRCPPHCRVARALACESFADEGQWLFVLEDLDAAGFTERRERLGTNAVRTCLAWLAHFHATFLGEPPLGLWPVGTYWHLETRPDELARCDDPQLSAAASWLDARLRAARYQTLVHGDAKVENFCFTRDLERVAAVDFQYTGAGCGILDVAYFFSSCLSDHVCETQGSELLDYYFEVLGNTLAQLRPEIDARALETEWRELYPIAWADFARFLSGWAPGHDARSGYAGRMTELALQAFPVAR